MFDGLDTLIKFGIFGMIVAAAAVVVGIPAAIWWAFHHITFH
jgi:hypothetical protein